MKKEIREILATPFILVGVLFSFISMWICGESYTSYVSKISMFLHKILQK